MTRCMRRLHSKRKTGAQAQKASSQHDNLSRPSLLMALTKLDRQGKQIDNAAYASLLRWCGHEKALSHGRRIHAHISASGRDRSTFLSNLLVQMYGNCGSVKDALNVFNKTGHRNTFSWNLMIAAYAQNGLHAEAVELYREMHTEGAKPDKFTFLPVLTATANLRALEEGKQIQQHIVATGLNVDVAIATALVNMFGKCGSLQDAHAVFEQMQEQNVISWTALIAAYAQSGHAKEALELFTKMNLQGVKPNKVTFLTALDACARLGSLQKGKAIHQRIMAEGFNSAVAVRTALVHMYGKCGSPKDAMAVFEELPERDVILWSAMIAAYAQNGLGKEGLDLFRQMVLEGVKPNNVTFLSTLDACANLASLENGKEVHECINASGLAADVAVMNALVNMYGKCGSMENARSVFDRMHQRDLISWNAIIVAYAENGCGKDALELFAQMDSEDLKPDEITFLGVLNACSHAGFLDVAWKHFVFMSKEYDIVPFEMHYVCMSNLLGRDGCLDEAEDLVMNMPSQPTAVAWNSLLGACRIHGDGERGTRVADYIFKLDPDNALPYIVLSNIHAAARRWDTLPN